MALLRFQWFTIQNLVVTVGLNDYGARKLGPILRVCPTRTAQVELDQKIADIETKDYLFPLEAPFSGRVIEFNPQILKDPSLISRDPEEKGWIYRLRIQPNLDTCGEFMINIQRY